MKNTIYVIGDRTVFDAEFALFQQGQGWYFDNQFSNWGAIRYSLDGTKVLLEEVQEKFKPEHLALESTTVYTEEEIKAYLIANRAEWEEEDII